MTPDAMMTTPKTAKPKPISTAERGRLYRRNRYWRRDSGARRWLAHSRPATIARLATTISGTLRSEPGIGDEIAAFC